MQDVIYVFKALSDRTRLKMLDYIKGNNACICCDIANALNKDVSTVFRHIEILERTGLIKVKRKGKRLICSLPNKKELKKLLSTAERIGGD